MKKNLLIIAIIIASSSLFARNGSQKVNILHNGKVISVSSNALNTFLRKGAEQVFMFNGEYMTQAQIDAMQSEQQYEEEEGDGEEPDTSY